MTFIHPILLGGLIFVGVPILLHLIMRQKPKHLLFPAVRFLLARQRTNQRKLQLRHLLLLLLRMALLVFICLALARPRIFSERLNLVSNDRPVAAVLVFDTSPSMEYKAAGKTRLDEAKRRGQELLGDLPDGSQVAVFDTAEHGDEFRALSLARERISGLQIRPANSAVTGQFTLAFDMLARLVQQHENPAETPLPFLYVFSDRTQACWDASQLENLKRLRERVPPPGVQCVFVDVGVEKSEDLAIANLELPRQFIPLDGKVEVRATVRATGRAYDSELICRIDGEEAGHKPIKLDTGQSQVILFERGKLTPGPHQVEVALRAADAALTFNDVRFASFEVRGGRKVLTLTGGDPAEARRLWNLALASGNMFQSRVLPIREVADLGPKDLASYQVVCLMNVREPSQFLWEKLDQYVRDGGGLAILPGGEEMDIEDSKKHYNDDKFAQGLMPGRLVKLVRSENERGTTWADVTSKHPIVAQFREWAERGDIDFLKPGFERVTRRYWDVTPKEAEVIVSYADKEKHPALLERKLDKKYRGRVLLFTTPLDDLHTGGRQGDWTQSWNNYAETSSFYLILAHKTIGSLAGDNEDGNFNFLCGQTVPIPLPATPRYPNYTVQGPGLAAAEALVSRAPAEGELHLDKAVLPGNYTVVGVDEKSRWASVFSMNVPPEETVLARIPAEQIEALFGPGSVLPLEAKTNLREALLDRWSQPIELFPWLMILVLLLLAVENLLANKFYRREEPVEDDKVTQVTR